MLGRCGRAQGVGCVADVAGCAQGIATSFVTPEDKDIYYDLKQARRGAAHGLAHAAVLTRRHVLRPSSPRQLLTESGNVVPPELARHEASRKKPQKGPDFGRNIES